MAHPKAKSHQDLAGSLDNIEFERLQKRSLEIFKDARYISHDRETGGRYIQEGVHDSFEPVVGAVS